MAVLTDVPIVGAVTDTAAKVWFRTDTKANVAVQYGTNVDLSGAVATSALKTIRASDFTGIITLSGLQAETTYYYRILVGGVPQDTSDFASFTTFAPAGSTREFSFAVTADIESGNDNPNQPAPVYAQVEADNPSFVMQIGDFDHRDPAKLSKMRTMHRQVRSGTAMASGADFAEHIADEFPLFHVWDDHDYGKNNGDKTFAHRAEALQAFKEYYPTPTLPNPAGIWHSFSFAQAEFFMLDLRSQRDNHLDTDGASKSMLDGDNIANDQKDWLKAGLLSSTATWKFVITSVPFNPTVEKKDGWAKYETERQDLLNFIATNNIEGVVLISADMHLGGAIDDGTNSGLPEVSVPHTNMEADHANTTTQPGTWSEGVISGVDNPGYTFIRVTETQVILENKGPDGTVRQSLVLGTVPLTAGGISGFVESSESEATATAMLASTQTVAAATNTGAPNIVVFVTDDQRFDSLQFMPNVQRELVQRGTTFDKAFVTTALSGPSRASMFSGLYAHNHGVLNNGEKAGGVGHFDATSTIATWLGDAGYRTGIVGKYMNQYDGSPILGWDEVHVSDKPDYYNYTLYDNGVPTLHGAAPEDYFTDVVATKTLEFLEQSEANDAQPFLLFVGVGAPHKPATPAPRHANLFNDLPAYRPPSFNEADVSDKPQWIQALPLLTAKQINGIDKAAKGVARTLQAVDEAFGSLMDTLRANDELDNTVVMFISDNGLLNGEHRHNEKKAAYEEAIRVPLLVFDGRDPVRRQSNKMVLNIDLAPTIAELAGVPVPDDLDGQSLAPLLAGGTAAQWRKDFLIENFTAATERHNAIRTSRFLYVEYQNGNREFYDLYLDPYQLNSQHNNPAFAGLITSLSARMNQLLAT